jgi:hypothetical protein
VRQKRVYKTAEEVLEESAGAGGSKVAAQPILDLRGPQARLVTDLEQLNATEGVHLFVHLRLAAVGGWWSCWVGGVGGGVGHSVWRAGGGGGVTAEEGLEK